MDTFRDIAELYMKNLEIESILNSEGLTLSTLSRNNFNNASYICG